MRGKSKDGGKRRAPPPRFRLVGLLSLLALIVGSSLGTLGTAAGAAPKARPTPIEKVQVDRFQGLRFGRDPSLNSSWTSGNLCGSSKECYHELDDVPFRIGFKALKIGTLYTITVLIDARDRAGHLGYDNINSVVPVFGIADAVSVVQNPDTLSGCGSTACESYTFTFTASDNRAEIRFNAHLAVGAHQFSGASLSVRLADVGTRNIPLPVKEILLDIRAHKFNDLNGNRIQDSGEPDLTGWTMTLYAGTTCEGRPVEVSGNPGVTDTDGNVNWIDLSADQGMGGEFSVAETLQDRWENTLPGAATTNPGVPCVVVEVVDGQNFADFGNQTVQAPPPPPPPRELGIHIEKDGPALVHVGDTITYRFAVTLTIETPLTDVEVTDPECDAGPTLVSKEGGNQNDMLQPGETWNYRCDHVVTANDPDPLPNTATATGTAPDGSRASDQDSHMVDIIHPDIQVVKTARPRSVSPGQSITYTYVTTNNGDTTLFDVDVTDDKLGDICSFQSLDVGESETCTAGIEAPERSGPIDNVATAEGEDVLGMSVRDRDPAHVTVVLAGTVTPPPTTTPPGGLPFTGAARVIPLAGLALLLLLAGSGMMFAARRRGDGSET